LKYKNVTIEKCELWRLSNDYTVCELNIQIEDDSVEHSNYKQEKEREKEKELKNERDNQIYEDVKKILAKKSINEFFIELC